MVRHTRLTICLLVYLFCQPVPGASAGGYGDITILSETPAGLTFRYDAADLTWIDDPSGGYPHVAGAALRRLEGRPTVPGRIVYVALPPGSATVDAVVVAHAGEGRMAHPRPESNAAGFAASAPGLYPADRLVVDGVFMMRGLRVARLILHPVQAVIPANDFSTLESMTIRLTYDQTGPVVTTVHTPTPRDAFNDIFDEILLNPEQGRLWQRESRPRIGASVEGTHPFAGSAEWYAIRTRGDGAVAVTNADLTAAGVDLSSADPRRFRLFSGEGRQLSTKMSDPPPAFGEVAILIEGEDDGSFDSGDRLLFWAPGLNRWDIGDDGELADVVHRYDRDNVFWLAVDGTFAGAPLRMGSLPSLPPDQSPVTLFSAPSRVRREDNTIFRIGGFGYVESYYTWYWRNAQSGAISMAQAVNAEPGAPAQIQFSTFAGRAGRQAALLRVGNTLRQADRFVPWASEDRTTFSFFDFPDFDPTVQYVLEFPTAPGPGEQNFYLDYYTVSYERRLDLSAGPQKFPAPDTDAVVSFVIANAGSAAVWDITDPSAATVVTGVSVDGNVARFAADVSGGARRVYYVRDAAQTARPRSITRVTPEDIHAPASGAVYLMVGPREFAGAMQEFAAHRAATDGFSTRYVALEDIYNSFSLGLSDPVAIRRFLRHAFFNWPDATPVYVLLVGDGSHDYLNHTGSRPLNLVPPYITADDNVVSDEHYVYFSDRFVLNADQQGEIPDNPFPDMLIGRWPVRSTTEIAALTSKIKRYESNENLGAWRSRVMLVADDEFGDRTGATPSVVEKIHTVDSERISRNAIPPRFDLQKIYLTEFPFDNAGCTSPFALGCRKPAVKEAIVAGLNEGVAVFDYVGHGNMDLMAHERIFERASDLPRLLNAETPTAVLTFSCSIGFFDHPSREGMSEEWLRMPQGGAVSVVSATRLSRATANADLNEEVFDQLFNRGVTGIGQAVYTAKLLRQYHDPVCALISGCPGGPPCPCDNDRGYMLLGDPAMRLGIPELRLVFDSVSPDSLSALHPTRVEGYVAGATGQVLEDFDGEVAVTVRDVPRDRLYRMSNGDSIFYALAGGTLFRGRSTVSNGRFSFDFVVPKDVAYGRQGARILGHAVGTDRMASGVLDSLWIAAAAATVTDTSGPAMTIATAEGQLVVDGFRIAEGSDLIVDLEDPSGINLTGAPGHRLLVFAGESDDPLVDLTDEFTYDPGTAVKGRARFSLAGLARGPIRLLIHAWDNANNSSVVAVDLEIAASELASDFEITEFLTYPNPLQDETTFYFRATRAIERATIRVFTVAGRLIWESANARDGEVEWHGRDQVGDRVANGVYLAQIEASGRVASGGELVDKRAYMETKLVVSR